ncbi:MAG: L-aspartate oxidase [Longimicrobiales bacterium]|nr:L-aspartate oxidase [Longimicrobiales bacterium]
MSGVDVPVMVVGTGIAGLSFALKVAQHADVLLLTKKDRADSSTNWARGGIAAVMGPDDTPGLHVRDTMVAGAGLCHRDVVEAVVREGPARIRDLMAWGARFQAKDGALSLAREGGHSRRRILHAGDRTGWSIEHALLAAVADAPRIRLVEDMMVVDLLLEGPPEARRCAGVRAIQRHTGDEVRITARVVLLASGGAGQVYRHTTNPGIATGDGVAMAFRAGARVANMEFIQFHPTALYPSEDPAFLISEAVRGEGAVLRTRAGHPFMDRLHPLASLAPRDIVARGIHHSLRETGDPHVVLDVSAIPPEVFAARFPSTLEGCRERAIDPWEEGIPVVPAAHYQCGGVWTDRRGATSLPGLYATGEAACTGLHGANRLASNSLLEAVVYSHRAAEAIRGAVTGDRSRPGRVQALELPTPPSEAPAPGAGGEDPERTALRRLLWDHAGIERRWSELDAWHDETRARLEVEEDRFRAAAALSTARAECRNLHWVGYLILRSALERGESRGLHYLSDRPHRNNERFLRDTVLVRSHGSEVDGVSL